jgi:hypothetical protein
MVIGHAYSATIASEALLPGLKIDRFTVWQGQNPPFDLKAYNGTATFTYTPVGDVGGVTEIKIKAFASGSEGYDSPVSTFDYALTDVIAPVTSIISPKSGDSVSPKGMVITLNIPTYYLGQILQSVQAQVAADNTFANIIWNSGTVNATQSLTVGTLAKDTPYYIRARSYGSVTGWGEWSDYVGVQTQSVSVGDVVTVGTPGSGFVWTVPETGLFLIELAGPGGSGLYRSLYAPFGKTYALAGGAGGLCRHQSHLTKGQQLQIVIGAGRAVVTPGDPGQWGVGTNTVYTASNGSSATTLSAFGLIANPGTGASLRGHTSGDSIDYGFERNGTSGSASGGNIWNTTGQGGAAGPAPNTGNSTITCVGSGAGTTCVGASMGGNGWFKYTYLGA